MVVFFSPLHAYHRRYEIFWVPSAASLAFCYPVVLSSSRQCFRSSSICPQHGHTLDFCYIPILFIYPTLFFMILDASHNQASVLCLILVTSFHSFLQSCSKFRNYIFALFFLLGNAGQLYDTVGHNLGHSFPIVPFP